MVRFAALPHLEPSWISAARRQTRQTPPTLAEIQNFLENEQHACQEEMHRLEHAPNGGVGGQQSAVPIGELQNFSFAMCFCASPSPFIRMPAHVALSVVSDSTNAVACPSVSLD